MGGVSRSRSVTVCPFLAAIWTVSTRCGALEPNPGAAAPDSGHWPFLLVRRFVPQKYSREALQRFHPHACATCRRRPLPLKKLTSGRLFGYLARRPGNRAPPHGAPGEEQARNACKRWTPDRGVARSGR
jgi:hypothetical protein